MPSRLFEAKSGGLLQSVHQSAQAMVNRHFSLHQFPDWRPEFARVQHLFALMHIASARQTGDSEWNGIFVPNTGSSMEPGVAAYCYPAGYRKPGVETNVLPFAQRTDRIYLCRPLAKDPVKIPDHGFGA